MVAYRTNAVIMAGVAILCFAAAWRTRDWGALEMLAVSLALDAAYIVFFQRPYRIWYDSVKIGMDASGGKNVVAIADVDTVRYEVGAAVGRPFRRVVIRGRKHRKGNWIDVSLRHFHLADIELLLAELRRQRPGLSVPTMAELAGDL